MASTTDTAPPSVTAPSAPAPMGPLRRGARELGLALITLGVIVFLFVGYQLWGTNFTEASDQHALARQFSADMTHTHAAPAGKATGGTSHSPTVGAPKAATALPSVPPGGALDHLVIPKIGVDKFVVEGTNEDDLRRGPGHYTGTPLPGQNGNSAIAGHRTTYGAPFFRLNDMAPGDPIYLTDLSGHTWEYKVSRAPVVVSPNDVAVLDPTSFPQLTLTTCNPRFEATSRLVVFARLVGSPQPVTTAPAQTTKSATKSVAEPAASTPAAATRTSVPAHESLGRGRSSAVAPTLLYGLLVVLMWIGVRIWINRTRRWHRLAAFVVGIGVCLIPLWFCFENAVLLLPQSI